MSETRKLTVPLNGGVLFLRNKSFLGLSNEEYRQIRKNIMDELKRTFEEAAKEGSVPILIPGSMEVMYIGPDGKVEKLEAVEGGPPEKE